MSKMQQNQELIRLLITRLERLSADSHWAHQASGVRGSLLRWIERGEGNPQLIEDLIEQGFGFLEQAIKEM